MGVFRAEGLLGQFILDSNDNGTLDAGDRVILYGFGGDKPVVGDWDGDGRDQIGVFRAIGSGGQFILDSNDNGAFGPEDRVFLYGFSSDAPVIGDWDGDGRDQVGNFRAIGSGGQFILDSNDSGAWEPSDRVMMYGFASDVPVIGRWAPPSPLMAAEGEADFSADVPVLQSSELEPIVREALTSWLAVGLDPKQAALLASVEYVITDLPGATLGLAEHTTIYLDYNAAGYGWFVDPTPALDEEFELAGAGTTMRAFEPAVGSRVDLLTVVSHELGHVLGLDDLDALSEALMSGTLERGVRHKPGVAELDALFAKYGAVV
jgi:hypothetical protein